MGSRFGRHQAALVAALLAILSSAASVGCDVSGFEEVEDGSGPSASGKADGLSGGPLTIVEIGPDFVELRNDSQDPIDLDGWLLSFSRRRVLLEPVDARSTVVPAGGLAIVSAPGAIPPRVPSWLPVVTTSRDFAELIAHSRSLILRTPERSFVDRIDARGKTPVGIAAERALKTTVVASELGATPGARNVRRDLARMVVHFASPLTDEVSPLPAALASFIDRAHSSLDGAFYQLGHAEVVAALVRARDRGVSVRLVLDTDYADDDAYHGAYAELDAAGIEYVFDGRSARQHNKFLVRDDSAVWTGSYNPVPERAEFITFEDAVEIVSRDVAATHAAEFDEMFGGTFGVHKSDGGGHQAHVDGARVQTFFAPTDDVKGVVLAEIAAANSSIHFNQFSFYLADVGAALIDKAASGVHVAGTFDRTTASSITQWQPMTEAGIDVRRPYFEAFLHHKFIILDHGTTDARVITGSFNLTNKADTVNDESIVVLHEPHIVAQYYRAWLRLFGECEGPNQDTSAAPPVAISEVLIDTTGVAGGSFVELANTSAQAVDLGGLSLRDRDGAVVPVAGSLAAGGRVLVELDGSAFDHSDPLALVDDGGRAVSQLLSPAFVGEGRSLERDELSTAAVDATWSPSGSVGGTPGE